MVAVLTYSTPVLWLSLIIAQAYLMRKGQTPKWSDVFIPTGVLLCTSLISAAQLFVKGLR